MGGVATPTLVGFLLDEALSGSAHFDRAIARGAGFTHKVGKVSSSMGEDMGLWYLQSVVGPSCLYQGSGLRRRVGNAKKSVRF